MTVTFSISELPINLVTLDNGAVVNLFDTLLVEVLENILNPETEPDAKRVMVLRFEFKPDKERLATMITIRGKTVLAPERPEATIIHVWRKGDGSPTATEEDPKQKKLFDKPNQES